MNKAIIAGRLTRDPEIRYSQSNEPVAVTRMSVAVNRRFKRDGEPTADFINCVAFGKTGEFINKYFRKGSMIGIVGNIRTNTWTDNNDQKRYSTEIFVEEAEFLESKKASEGANHSDNTPSEAPKKTSPQSSDDFYNVETSVNDDNLPF